MNFEQWNNYLGECKKLEVCCLKCKHIGRTLYVDRTPSGVCQLNPPTGKYIVTKLSLLFATPENDGRFLQKNEDLEVVFPPINPHDKCGKFELDESKG